MILVYGVPSHARLFERAKRYSSRNTETCDPLSYDFGNRRFCLWSRPGSISWSTSRSAFCFTSASRNSNLSEERISRLRSSVSISNDRISLADNINGSATRFEYENGKLQLGTDPSGMFPIFYLILPKAIIASSSLAAVGYVAEAQVDMTGVRSFLRNATATSKRTPFLNVKRLRPGESLTFNPDRNAVELISTSKLWACDTKNELAQEEYVREAWERLNQTVHEHVFDHSDVALMFSGGWDSRTLLSTLRNSLPASKLQCYIHGDITSREVKFAKKIASASRIKTTIEPLNSKLLSHNALSDRFKHTGNVVFPHWHWAGTAIQSKGANVAVSGIFGEIFGGHYGPSFQLNGMRKALGVAAELGLPVPSPTPARIDKNFLLDYFRDDDSKPPWFINSSVEDEYVSARNTCNLDVEEEIAYLHGRGVSMNHCLIEAYLTEQRHAQYVGEQLLSLRPDVSISAPFATPSFLNFATQIPPSLKVHNRLNRALLKTHAPDLLDYPMAATLVPAKAPIFVQEMSRAIRKLYEVSRRHGNRTAPRLMKYPRLGWANFEFLRHDNSLVSLVEHLKADIWDRVSPRYHGRLS